MKQHQKQKPEIVIRGKAKVKDYGHALKQPIVEKEVTLEREIDEKPLELGDLAEPLRSHVEAVI